MENQLYIRSKIYRISVRRWILVLRCPLSQSFPQALSFILFLSLSSSLTLFRCFRSTSEFANSNSPLLWKRRWSTGRNKQADERMNRTLLPQTSRLTTTREYSSRSINSGGSVRCHQRLCLRWSKSNLALQFPCDLSLCARARVCVCVNQAQHYPISLVDSITNQLVAN